MRIALLVLASLCACPHALADGFVEFDVLFESEGLKLAGTVFVPDSVENEESIGAVAVTHGSERASRRNVGYRWLGMNLAKKGLAALIWDKRGVGDSEGEYEETPDFDRPVADVLAAVRQLATIPGVDPQRIGVLGFSQGGWVGPLAASRSDSIGFVVMLVGPAVSVREQIVFDRGNQLLARGIDAQTVGRARGFMRDLFVYLGTGEKPAGLGERYAAEASEPWFEILRVQGFGDALPPPESLDAPVFEFFRKMRFDPKPALEKVRVPVLAVYGGEDPIVPTQASVERLQAAQRKAGNASQLEVHVIESMGHNLWDTSGRSPRLDRALQDILWPWLKKVASPRPAPTLQSSLF